MPRWFVSVCAIIVLALGASAHAAAGRRLAFLRDGKLWTLDLGTRRETLLIRDKSRIASFVFSPGGTHVAYARVIAMDEDILEPEIREAVIYDLGQRTVVAELGSESGSLIPDAWASDSSLVLSFSSGWDGMLGEVYDLTTSTRTPEQDSPMVDWVFADTLVYETYAETPLDVVDRMVLYERSRNTYPGRELTSKRDIRQLQPSPDGLRLAYVELDRAAIVDRVWVYDRSIRSEKLVHEGRAGDRTAGIVAWSTDGRRLSVCCTDRRTLVLNTVGPLRQEWIDERVVAWLGHDEVLAGDEERYRAIDLDTGKRTVLRGIRAPVLLPAR